jgi:hypothetical protein
MLLTKMHTPVLGVCVPGPTLAYQSSCKLQRLVVLVTTLCTWCNIGLAIPPYLEQFAIMASMFT